jgi:hypothetical protein
MATLRQKTTSNLPMPVKGFMRLNFLNTAMALISSLIFQPSPMRVK